MTPRNKSESEDVTIFSIETVAAELRKQSEILERVIKQMKEEKEALRKEGGDGRESEST